MKDRKREFPWRIYIVYFGISAFAIAIAFKVFQIQFVEGSKWLKRADTVVTSVRSIPADRGHIYSEDGRLLATSVPEYEMRMDLRADALTDAIFNEALDSLSWNLSQLFDDRSAEEYKRNLTNARERGDRYYLIQRKVTYKELKILKEFPLIRRGRYKSGVIIEKNTVRIKPFDRLASRTVGYSYGEGARVGIEAGFNKELKGIEGKRLERKLTGGVWMPVRDGNEVDPEDGFDIVTTIDMNLQDVADKELYHQLVANDAEHGCVVVMETETGYIKAISNLTRTKDGTYIEDYNYALGASTEPGSTFKLPALLACIEEGKVEITDIVDTKKGVVKFYDRKIRDSHEGGYGKITVKEAFGVSSNTAMAQLVNNSFQKDPVKFIQHLHDFNLHEPLNTEIPGEGMPFIKTPDRTDWSGVTLPYMAHGYELQLTPLQILTFYNAIANNGEMVKPQFVSSIRKGAKVVEERGPIVLNKKICSDETLAIAKELLEYVVESGTATNLKSANFKIAGKTGTAKVLQDGRYNLKIPKYRASFVGYFPADAPKYSCIVVIHDPSNGRIYGNSVAGPIFKEIANKIYSNRLELQKEYVASNDTTVKLPISMSGYAKDLETVFDQFEVPYQQDSQGEWVTTATGQEVVIVRDRAIPSEKTHMVPNVLGMGLRDAIYLMENRGLDVEVKGSGMVKKQSIGAGQKITPGARIILELS